MAEEVFPGDETATGPRKQWHLCGWRRICPRDFPCPVHLALISRNISSSRKGRGLAVIATSAGRLEGAKARRPYLCLSIFWPQRTLPRRSPRRNRSEYVHVVALADVFLDLLLYENARL